jgi:CcmD family protein
MLGLAIVVAPALLFAQDAQKQFVPVENLPKQEVAPGPLVYGAYALVWAAVVVYLFSLWRRLGRVERELSDVNRKLAGHR